MTTLKDIAAAAGVSIGTVDRALKDRGRVNPQVAQHIKDLAKEMVIIRIKLLPDS